MNWERGIKRLVWSVSSLTALVVFFSGNLSDIDECIECICKAAVAFGFVWLLYALSLYIYRGFQDKKTNNKESATKSPFWQWATGRFSPENDPYLKKEKQKEGR